ncbi:MAG: C25 family cysteine peptidase [candidate division WOR-3 bacterium]
MRYLILFLSITLTFAGWLGKGKLEEPVKINLVSHTYQEAVLEISIPGIKTEDIEKGGVIYTKLYLLGEEGTTEEVGKPELPKISRVIGIPDNGKVEVEILESRYETYENILVYPFQPPTTDEKENREFVIDRYFYNNATSYPENILLSLSYARWRETYLANLVFVPFNYDAVNKRLKVYHYLKVKVRYISGYWQTKIIEPWFAKVLKKTLLNYEDYPKDVRYIDSPGVRYLVITHSNFAEAIDTLVKWHYKRGIETRVISKSSWTSQEIKDSIVAEYNRNSPPVLRWVLLVGDANYVPPSYAFGSFPSDFWYCDFPTIDYYGEVGIGRFSCQTVPELQVMLKKTLKFMINPPLDTWLAKSVLVAHKEQYPAKYSACKRGIYFHNYPYYKYDMDTLMGALPYATNAALIARIDSGRVIVNYRGHGLETAWDAWGYDNQQWGAAQINALNNGDRTPVVFNIACLCHRIDHSTDCLGELWLKKYPGGAVASLGASDPSYTIPNHGYDSMLYRCLGDTITIPTPARNYKAPMWDLGWLMLFADAHIALRHQGSGGPDNIEMYFWLGDPALEVWTGKPVSPLVQHPMVVPLGPYQMAVTVLKQGMPLEGALVCAYKENEFYVYGYTNQAGQVTLNINAQTPGEFSLTVTGHEILPYTATCMATPGTTPYVIYLRHYIDDAPPNGNGDGIVNPGERINLPVWVKNVGGALAEDVIGKLVINDPNINITDSLKTFGDIPQNDSAFTGEDGFKFEVATACTNGYLLNFQLICKDINDSTWVSYIPIIVGAPVINYHSLIVNDSIGNNNRRVDPNESAYIYIGLRNQGRGNAYNVYAILKSGDSRFHILDSFGTYGTILVDSVVYNYLDHFKVFAEPTIMPETPIPCTLYVYGEGGYFAIRPFTIVIGELRVSDPTPDNAQPTPRYWAYEDIDTAYAQRPEFEWVEIRNIGTRLPITSDDQTIQINLPFPFRYYGTLYTSQLSVCGNGWITPIYTTSTVYTNQPLPDPTSTNPSAMICPNWDDLYPPYGNGIWFLYDATNHRMILEWDSVHYYNPREQWDKFQIIIYDTTVRTPTGDNMIKFQYLTANYYQSNTVGIEDQTNTIGINFVYNNTYHRTAGTLTNQKAILINTYQPSAPGKEEVLANKLLKDKKFSYLASPIVDLPKLNLYLTSDQKVKIDIYDLTGRHIRTLINKELKAGSHTIIWDKKDNQGKEVAKGIYFYQINTKDTQKVLKAVILK